MAENVLDEVTFGWPRQKGNYQLRENLALGLQRAINWVVMPLYIAGCLLIQYIYSVCVCTFYLWSILYLKPSLLIYVYISCLVLFLIHHYRLD